jgi:hypothetical protein
VISTRIYQELANSNVSITPIGKQIMLASILRNQGWSVTEILNVALVSATGVMALLSPSAAVRVPNGVKTAMGVTTLTLSQLSNVLKPVIGQDKVEKFEREVLESALVLDTGSCVERTLFVATSEPKAKPATLQFRVK